MDSRTGFINAGDFKLMQDPRASQIILDCGAPLVHIPCLGVSSHLLTCVSELEGALKCRNAISDFLFSRFCDYSQDHFTWAKEIWDIATAAYMLNDEWVPTRLIPAPVLGEDLTWQAQPPGRHTVREAWYVQRNPIFRYMFLKLQNFNL